MQALCKIVQGCPAGLKSRVRGKGNGRRGGVRCLPAALAPAETMRCAQGAGRQHWMTVDVYWWHGGGFIAAPGCCQTNTPQMMDPALGWYWSMCYAWLALSRSNKKNENRQVGSFGPASRRLAPSSGYELAAGAAAAAAAGLVEHGRRLRQLAHRAQQPHLLGLGAGSWVAASC